MTSHGYGNKALSGGPGDDFLFDVVGNDTLDGGAGNDELLLLGRDGKAVQVHATGGDGDDRFLIPIDVDSHVFADGGAGRDVFTLTGVLGRASIVLTGFEAGAGGDFLDLEALVSGSHDNPFAPGPGQVLRLVQHGTDAVLQYSHYGPDYGDYVDLLTFEGLDKNSLAAANFWHGFNPDGSTHGLAIAGTGQDDSLDGGYLDDTVTAGAGNDTLYGGPGDDVLAGGAGRDVAIYGGRDVDYRITRDGAGWHVSDQRDPDILLYDGNDTLQDIERIRFGYGGLALDTDGTAGQAYRIYRAAFDRTPDAGGLGFWIAAMDKGTTLEQVASGFAASKEFADLYGAAPANADLVGRLYQNILHRAPDPAGYDYWLGVLNNKQAALPQVLAAISASAENQQAVADLIANGIPYTPYVG